MKKYLILAEMDNEGVFVEVHSELDVAMKRSQLYFELAFNPPINDVKLFQEFTILGSYKLYDKRSYFFNSIYGSSNGFHSTHIIEIDETFNYDKFSKLRSSAQYMTFNQGTIELWDLEDKYSEGICKEIWVN